MSGDDIVTVKTFSTLHEAEIARGFLEAQGIQAFVPDQNAHIFKHYVPLNQIRLQVRARDVELAKQLLESLAVEE